MSPSSSPRGRAGGAGTLDALPGAVVAFAVREPARGADNHARDGIGLARATREEQYCAVQRCQTHPVRAGHGEQVVRRRLTLVRGPDRAVAMFRRSARVLVVLARAGKPQG